MPLRPWKCEASGCTGARRRLWWVGSQARAVALGVAALSGAACGSRPESPDAVALRQPPTWRRRSFDFRAPSGAVISSETVRGRPTVLLFVTTHDLGSQMALRQLELVVGTFKPRANAAAIVVEPPLFASLLSTFEQTLGLPFPAVMADYATLRGNGPFGPLPELPVAVVLDRHGFEQARLGPNEIREQTLRTELAAAAAVARGVRSGARAAP